MSWQKAIAFVLKWEGGLHDDPDDPGGLTNYGIALREHPSMTAEQIRTLTPASASAIYMAEYWTPLKAAQLPAPFQLPVFNAAVMAGVAEASMALEAALSDRVDGVIGPDTIKSANSANAEAVLPQFAARFLFYLAETNDMKEYFIGWSTRVVQSIMEAEFSGTT